MLNSLSPCSRLFSAGAVFLNVIFKVLPLGNLYVESIMFSVKALTLYSSCIISSGVWEKASGSIPNMMIVRFDLSSGGMIGEKLLSLSASMHCRSKIRSVSSSRLVMTLKPSCSWIILEAYILLLARMFRSSSLVSVFWVWCFILILPIIVA